MRSGAADLWAESFGDGATFGDGRREDADLAAEDVFADVDQRIHNQFPLLDLVGSTHDLVRRLRLHEHLHQKNADGIPSRPRRPKLRYRKNTNWLFQLLRSQLDTDPFLLTQSNPSDELTDPIKFSLFLHNLDPIQSIDGSNPGPTLTVTGTNVAARLSTTLTACLARGYYSGRRERNARYKNAHCLFQLRHLPACRQSIL